MKEKVKSLCFLNMKDRHAPNINNSTFKRILILKKGTVQFFLESNMQSLLGN